MKFNKTLITTSLALVYLIFASCADSGSTAGTGNTTIKSFPMTEGSYWITENYVTDQDDQLTGDVTIDSTVVGGTVVKAGETGRLFIDYSLDEQNVYIKSGETVYRMEDDKLYYFGNLLDQMIDIDLPGLAEDEWLNLIDFNSSIWEVARIEITEDDGNFFTAEMDIIGRNSNNSKDFVVSGKTVKAQEYVIDIEGQITIPGIPVPITLDRKKHIWYAEDVGLVQQYLEPATIMTTSSPGEMINLIRYHIK